MNLSVLGRSIREDGEQSAREFIVTMHRLRYSRNAVEPLDKYSRDIGRWSYADERAGYEPYSKEGAESLGNIIVSYRDRKVWAVAYKIHLEPRFIEGISICLNQSRSLANPRMPIIGPEAHVSSNGYIYRSSCRYGSFDKFFDVYECIQDEGGHCVCQIWSSGGYLS